MSHGNHVGGGAVSSNNTQQSENHQDRQKPHMNLVRIDRISETQPNGTTHCPPQGHTASKIHLKTQSPFFHLSSCACQYLQMARQNGWAIFFFFFFLFLFFLFFCNLSSTLLQWPLLGCCVYILGADLPNLSAICG